MEYWQEEFIKFVKDDLVLAERCLSSDLKNPILSKVPNEWRKRIIRAFSPKNFF